MEEFHAHTHKYASGAVRKHTPIQRDVHVWKTASRE